MSAGPGSPHGQRRGVLGVMIRAAAGRRFHSKRPRRQILEEMRWERAAFGAVAHVIVTVSVLAVAGLEPSLATAAVLVMLSALIGGGTTYSWHRVLDAIERTHVDDVDAAYRAMRDQVGERASARRTRSRERRRAADTWIVWFVGGGR